MAENKKKAEDQNQEAQAGASSDDQVAEQASQQAGRQIQLRIDEREMSTNYANAFRTNPTTEEVMVDFGVNLLSNMGNGQAGADGKQPAAQMLFKINNRVVLNYYTAKRLAIQLGQLIRQHEQQFGELKLNARDRMAK